jgi:tetratricopeptide (TPR) repeat protein
MGRRLMQAGRSLDAQLCCQQALALEPNHVDTLHLMGLLSLQAKQYDHAVAWIARANLQDRKADYLCSLGIALEQQSLHSEALKAFDKGVEVKPDDAELWVARGDAQARLGQQAEALLSYQRVAKLNPANPDICNTIGASLQKLGRDEEALTWFDKAIALHPRFVRALLNKAFTLTQLQHFDAAFAAFDLAKAIDPDNADLKFLLSLLHLLTGNFEAGWAGREARWQTETRPASYPQYAQPMWRGDADVAGKTILVLEDEGLGDTIQFARYIPMLAARGARVVLLVGDPVHSLLSKLPGVAQCIPKSLRALPAFDMHCPVCSLPLAFGMRLETVPSAVPYLPVPPVEQVQAWEGRLRDRLGPRSGLRVGLAWSGRPTHVNDRNRSLPLRSLLPLLDCGATFVSLQKEVRPEDAAILRERAEIVDLTARLTDFAETAALASCLDLVITVDTAVAHLAGALARPIWLLLPYTPDYRWLLDRDDSPWYPTMRLFRQDASRDYAGVIERVRAELVARVLSQVSSGARA